MKLGLCFAGGGVKGAAHIGVLKALEEENINYDLIGGTSSGSIVATLSAAGYKSDEIYELFIKYCRNLKYVDGKNIIKLIVGLIFERKIKIDGLTDGSKIEKIVEKACEDRGAYWIKDIKKPLFIPSVDLYDGKVYIFTSRTNRKMLSNKTVYENNIPIGKAVRASCSYPGVFSPCECNGVELIDGGIRENVPWKELKENGADKVISVVFQNELKPKKKKNIIDVVSGALDMICHELSEYELNGADYCITIKTKNIALLDYSKIDYLYKLGYEQTKKQISKIKQVC